MRGSKIMVMSNSNRYISLSCIKISKLINEYKQTLINSVLELFGKRSNRGGKMGRSDELVFGYFMIDQFASA